MTEQAIIFTIARMNPPTSGHMYVIKSLLEKARDLNQKKVYILLSKTTGEKTDPLRCGEKRDLLLSGMIDKVKEYTPGTEEIEAVIMCGYIRGLVTAGANEEFVAKEMDAGLSRDLAEELYATLDERLSAMDTPEKKRKTTTVRSATARSTTARSATTTTRSKRAKTAIGGKKRRRTIKLRRKRKYN